MIQAGSGIVASALGIPYFFLYLLLGGVMLAVFVIIYSRITSHDELALIRTGNLTAAVAFSGSIIGFSIPLAKAISQAGNLIDMALWGGVACLVQLGVYFVVKMMIPDLSAKIESNTAAVGVLLAGCSLACGMLNAAAMTG